MSGTIMGIQGQPLEVTVVSCSKLKDTEWISRQDPYVCVEYGSSKFRTRTCTDGGKNPAFQEKFIIPLIEGLRELTVVVWNSNTITFDDFIGTGKIQLHKVLSQGFDDSGWPLQTKTGRYAGEVKLILHYANANHKMQISGGSGGYGGSYVPTASPSVPLYSAPPPPPHSYSYPPPPQQQQYPPSASPAYPPPYPPPAPTTASSPYPYPPSSSYPYPPPHSSYPPTSSYPLPPQYPPSAPYPPAPPGIYPPPPY